MKFYGLRSKLDKNKIAIVTVVSNGDAEFCGGSTWTLELSEVDKHFEEIPLFYISKEIAEKARTANPGWYNSGYYSPEFEKGIKPEDLEIYEVETFKENVQ